METGKYYGNYLGEWLGAQATDPNALYGNLSLTVALSGDLTSGGSGAMTGAISFRIDASLTYESPRLGGFEMGRKVYIKRRGKIYIFNNTDEADAWAAADKQASEAIAKAQKTSQKSRKRVREALLSEFKPESVSIDLVRQLAEHFAMLDQVREAVVQEDWEQFLAIYHRAMELQDEEDVELLLLAG